MSNAQHIVNQVQRARRNGTPRWWVEEKLNGPWTFGMESAEKAETLAAWAKELDAAYGAA